MTKAQIIERQSKLILKLLAIGKDEMQDVSDLFAAIEIERQEQKIEEASALEECKPKKRGGWPKGKPRGRKGHENK